jgi:two-component system cell cycle sensor histidine kinase/response regulator CckA
MAPLAHGVVPRSLAPAHFNADRWAPPFLDDRSRRQRPLRTPRQAATEIDQQCTTRLTSLRLSPRNRAVVGPTRAAVTYSVLRPAPKQRRAVKTVSVPEPMQGLFAKAEEVVSRFFRDRVDDPAHGTIEIHGERYVLLRAAALSVEFFDLVRSLYAEDRRAEADEFARAILFDLAHAIGRTDARNFHEQMDLTDPIARLSAGPVHFAHTGWAFVEILPESQPTPDSDYCLVYDHPYSFESDAWVRYARHSQTPVCIMNAGYSSGWCEESFGLKLVSAEILCRAKGDETCRFVMAPPDRVSTRIAEYVARHAEIAPRAAHFRIPDFFARKREEENLKKRQDELERELRQTQKLEALGRLAGGIAHDFNNIISVVLGQAALAQRRVGAGDPLHADLAKIIRAGERAASLTQKLLTFGRSQVAQNDVLDLNLVVDETARMIERVIGDDVELSLRLAADAGCVRADRSQLEQVLMNLAVNARDAMPYGGRLLIATSRNGESLVDLVVSDSGVGMDAETRARAFEPFFSTKADRGSGLGLSTVYGIVTGAGASIALDTEPGRGCRFCLSFPRLPLRPTVSAPEPGRAAQGSGAVLIAEDRVELRELLERSLVESGYEVIAAENIDHALAVLADRDRHLDALLTDVVMPRMSGVELAARAVELRPGLKVLYMSGYAPDPQHRALFASDRAAFLQKPFSPDELAERLAALLRGP